MWSWSWSAVLGLGKWSCLRHWGAHCGCNWDLLLGVLSCIIINLSSYRSRGSPDQMGGVRFIELGVQGEWPQARGSWGVGCPLPTWSGVWGGGYAPSPENFWTFDFKMVHFGAF